MKGLILINSFAKSNPAIWRNWNSVILGQSWEGERRSGVPSSSGFRVITTTFRRRSTHAPASPATASAINIHEPQLKPPQNNFRIPTKPTATRITTTSIRNPLVAAVTHSPELETPQPGNANPPPEGEVVKVREKPTKVKKIANPIQPTLTQPQISKFAKVLSVIITGNRFSWCLIERINKYDKNNIDSSGKISPQNLELKLLDVQIFNLKPKMHFLKILAEAKTLIQTVPSCDVCITEEYPNQLRGLAASGTGNLNLEMTQARAMFLAVQASQQPNPPHMISIKTVALARLFSTIVGQEKVSGRFLVENILENGSNSNSSRSSSSSNMKIDDSIKELFLSSDSTTKEYLSNVFLVNLAYWILTKQYELSETNTNNFNYNSNSSSNTTDL